MSPSSTMCLLSLYLSPLSRFHSVYPSFSPLHHFRSHSPWIYSLILPLNPTTTSAFFSGPVYHRSWVFRTRHTCIIHMHNTLYCRELKKEHLWEHSCTHSHACTDTLPCIMLSCLITIQTSRPNNHNDIPRKCYWSLGNRQGTISSVGTLLFSTKSEWKSSMYKVSISLLLLYLFMSMPSASNE